MQSEPACRIYSSRLILKIFIINQLYFINLFEFLILEYNPFSLLFATLSTNSIFFAAGSFPRTVLESKVDIRTNECLF